MLIPKGDHIRGGIEIYIDIYKNKKIPHMLTHEGVFAPRCKKLPPSFGGGLTVDREGLVNSQVEGLAVDSLRASPTKRLPSPPPKYVIVLLVTVRWRGG